MRRRARLGRIFFSLLTARLCPPPLWHGLPESMSLQALRRVRHTLVSAVCAFDVRHAVRRLHVLWQAVVPTRAVVLRLSRAARKSIQPVRTCSSRQTSSAAAAPIVAGPIAPPPPVPVAAPMRPPPLMPLPAGNMQPHPSIPTSPTAPLAPRAAGCVGPPPVVTVPAAPMAYTTPTGAPVPVVAQSIAVPPPGAIPIGQDHLRITPDRLLAPVGSEVVLKAGICSAEGYLQRDRRVEWLLDSCSAGKFVDVAERDKIDIFRWVWDTPRKDDNNYVVGATSGQAVVLESRHARSERRHSSGRRRSMGQRHVGQRRHEPHHRLRAVGRQLAVPPGVGDDLLGRRTMDLSAVGRRRAGPAARVDDDVTRRTDGSPLAGWIVRYEVAGGASLGYEGGNFVEVPTDANGRASMEVSPSGSAAARRP